MSDFLRDLEVLAIDCQAGGATPAHGDLLEIGWAVCRAGAAGPVQSLWIVPRTKRRVPRAVRDLTGWSESCILEAVEEKAAWAALSEDIARIAAERSSGCAPAVIHFARFELGFLRDLHERIGGAGRFPLDAICLHAIAQRLFPDLPRRNIRALAGYLGHSPQLVRRSAGHVEATQFIFSALVPLLEQASVRSWSELRAWLDESSPSARPARRTFPFAVERRRALLDRPGVYRFLRRNGDVLYVGKAASVKKRVASHFGAHDRTTERALELLTQVHDISCTETPSVLEAALLEADEIKRLDPPYNVQLRSGERSAWFASRDLSEAVPKPDARHRIGPLPSWRALSPLWALISLTEGVRPTPVLQAAALAVPVSLLPNAELFDEGFRAFEADWLRAAEHSAGRRVARASLALWLERGRAEPDAPTEELTASEWDLARVRRRLERNLVQTGLLVRRARFLCLLADASVAYTERGMQGARVLVLSGGEIVERQELPSVLSVSDLPPRRARTLEQRQSTFDAASYDRLRVLLTELNRVREDGGRIALRIEKHVLEPERLSQLMRAI
jgi:DNA polymerase-3 subunit epsilon